MVNINQILKKKEMKNMRKWLEHKGYLIRKK